ncbi:hypothetical protein Veis_0104 [Verminephrobacter eiseniae EF01-2]|uniref:Uncharacterized protein n=2 Tax=Verminephrobacter eiseniae TaxID=364317 RepID=A1WE40_VEREI|nr:hypothetical protein Veis_0104 [Verminephrobacter eiseniae EF01-2]
MCDKISKLFHVGKWSASPAHNGRLSFAICSRGRYQGHEGHGTPSTRATPLTIAKASLSSKTPEGFNIYRKQSATLLEARPQRGHIGETWLRSSAVSPRSQCRCGIKRIFLPHLADGFDLARRQGHQGRALGFLMAIFQKIAASSFAAVRRTLKRRLLMLTLHEALLRDKDLDIEGRERLTSQARDLIHEEFGLPRDNIGRSEVERVLADLRHQLIRKLDEDALEMASDPHGSEYVAVRAEEAAGAVVALHLPEERLRIGALLKVFPQQRETKTQKLLDGLGTLWRQNPNEKIVVFAT